ncbi:MAG TPA: hypothetical protein VK610_07835, partial [Rhodothermales bacterium]|nr:hypothetical protein [Rhodothermales bacterium]
MPYATTSAGTGTTVSGGGENRPAYFDRTKFDALALSSLGLSTGTLQSGIQTVLRGVTGGAQVQVKNGAEMLRVPGMEDVNVTNAEGLYFAALDALATPRTGDATLGTATTITTSRRFGTATQPAVVRAPGGLSIASGGRVTGTGALVVEGPLTIAGTLDWDGLVIVHSEDDYLPVRFTGTARIDGALVVDQQGAPPGGHMDLSVWRAPTGNWNPAWGNITGSPFCGTRTGMRCALYQHTHKFDFTPVGAERGRTVFALDRDVVESQMQTALDALSNRQVRLEFVNGSTYSGMARYHMDVNGTVTDGAVRLGFAQPDGSYIERSAPFAANQLDHFDLAVRSLRMLRPLWDGVGSCDVSWPICVGEDRGRHSALTVRIVDAATGTIYYESAVYWHMQEAEVAEHEREEAEWRDRIENGAAFGTRLELGTRTTLIFDVDQIRRIGQRLGFDPPEYDVNTTTTQHWEPAQAGSPAVSHLPTSGTVTLCHQRNSTMVVPVTAAT